MTARGKFFKNNKLWFILNVKNKNAGAQKPLLMSVLDKQPQAQQLLLSGLTYCLQAIVNKILLEPPHTTSSLWIVVAISIG